MSVSKKIPITKPFIHPVTQKPILNVTDEFIKKHNISSKADLTSYADQFDMINLGDTIGILFDWVVCKNPSLSLMYSNLINSIIKAKKENENYVELTKDECTKVKSIFDDAIITIPKYNAYVHFIRESFEDFVKNFDTLSDKDVQANPEIKNQ